MWTADAAKARTTVDHSSNTVDVRERGWAALRVIVAALAALATGLAVYMFDRPAGSAAGLPDVLQFGAQGAAAAGPGGRLFGVLGGSLPTFAHVFAFSLLSVVLLPRGRRFVLAACAFWLGVNLVFEWLQQPAWSQPVAAWLRLNATALPGAEPLARYLLNGRFDLFDVLAAVLGALAACAVALRFRPEQPTSPREPS